MNVKLKVGGCLLFLLVVSNTQTIHAQNTPDQSAILSENLIIYEKPPSQVGFVFSTNPKKDNNKTILQKGDSVVIKDQKSVKTILEESIWYNIKFNSEGTEKSGWIYGGDMKDKENLELLNK